MCHTLSILGRLLIPKLEMNQFLNNQIFPQTQPLLLLFLAENEKPQNSISPLWSRISLSLSLSLSHSLQPPPSHASRGAAARAASRAALEGARRPGRPRGRRWRARGDAWRRWRARGGAGKRGRRRGGGEGGFRGGFRKIRGLDSDFSNKNWEDQNLIRGKILKEKFS